MELNMDNIKSRDLIIFGVLLFSGLSIAGVCIGRGMYKSRTHDRYVTVKGLAEREVEPDLAIWPITFSVTGDSLNNINREIDKNRTVIISFLIKNGFDSSMISHSPPKITDTKAERYYGEKVTHQYRYIAHTTVTLRTQEVKNAKNAMEKAGDLVSSGVAISEQNWNNSTEFIFTNLNGIKPEMIEEATQNARETAQKFAQDSGSKIGKIRNASQGFFSISDRDRNSPDYKKIRVVTTIEYYLIDN